MKRLIYEPEAGRVLVEDEAGVKEHPLETREAFNAVSEAWLRVGWDTKYVYSFTWLGRPMVQLPEDMIRVQEIIYRVKPDLIIETGIAHGGSLVFYAGLCKAMGKGRVVGIDIDIREHNRQALQAHELFDYVTLIEGSSIDPDVVDAVAAHADGCQDVLVMLDSNHTKSHVLSELQAYGPLVSVGSYIIAADGIMESLVGAPRASEDWEWNNPKAAALEFARSDPSFVLEEPPFSFNEGRVTDRVTYWPSAYLRRVTRPAL